MEQQGVREDEMEYDVDGDGLFVIIKQKNHNLKYRGEDWSKRGELNYDVDERRLHDQFAEDASGSDQVVEGSTRKKGLMKSIYSKLLKLFKPKQKENESQTQSTEEDNVIPGDDLTNEATGEKSFDLFMEKVQGYKGSPDFVMFFLMSHGFQNGEFLLARSDKGPVDGPCCGEKQWTDRHSLKEGCYGRHIVDHVISPVCKSYPGKPKIFIIQCCRGGESIAVKENEADPNTSKGKLNPQPPKGSPDIELFIPDFEDTFVFRASVKKDVSLVLARGDVPDALPDGGSLLIQHFCQSLKELEEANEQYDELIAKVREEQATCKAAMEDLVPTLEKRREDVTGGWIMNVCQRTTALVTNYLLVNVHLPKTALGQLLHQTPKYLNGLIDAKDNSLYNQFLNSLKEHKNVSQLTNEIEHVMQLCNCKDKVQGKWPATALLMYLWRNIRKHVPCEPLEGSHIPDQKKPGAEKALNAIIKELRDQAEYKADTKQQPHISSSLSKKLSCVKMMKEKEWSN